MIISDELVLKHLPSCGTFFIWLTPMLSRKTLLYHQNQSSSIKLHPVHTEDKLSSNLLIIVWSILKNGNTFSAGQCIVQVNGQLQSIVCECEASSVITGLNTKQVQKYDTTTHVHKCPLKAFGGQDCYPDGSSVLGLQEFSQFWPLGNNSQPI